MDTLDRTIAPPHYPISDPHFVEVQNSQELNLEMFSIDAASIDAVRIDLQFNAGTAFQKKALQASLCNKMLLSGTDSKSSYDLVKAFDELGAFTDVSLGKTQSSFTVYTLNKNASAVLDLVVEIFNTSVFPKHEFSSELNQMKQQFLVNSEKVSTLAQKGFFEKLFGEEHPYGRFAKLEDFNQLVIDDVRAFYKEHYNLSNCKLFISGKVSKEIKQEIVSKLGPLASKSAKKEFEMPVATSNMSAYFIEKPDALQSAIKMGSIFPEIYHEDYMPLKVLVTVLGGYFGSRLMSNIREDKGYTYGIGASLQAMNGCGLFVISTEVGSENTKDALSEIYKEIERLKTELISEQELKKVRNYLLGQLLKSADGPLDQMDMFKGVELHGMNQEYYVNYMNVIRTVTPAKLKGLANTYFQREYMVEVVAGAMH